MKKPARQAYVYIARCRDGSYYTGVAVDVAQRLDQHNTGRGAKYTRGRGPITLVHQEKCRSMSSALKREITIKKLKRAQKDALILGKNSK